MSRDIFDTLDKAGFGSNVHEIAAEGECRVLRLDGESGEGFMTMYRVFDGIYLMYNDFHMKHCVSEYQNADTVLCIDYCREGRIEHENALGERYYMEAGDLRIDKRVHHAGRVEQTFTVEELSEISGMPPASLRKLFKAVYGTPVYQYIKSYKMKATAEMLISDRRMNIADIAQRLGYDNASKFSAAFRDVMGVTPQNYRNRQEEQ